jgi:hypothetical protein
MVELKTIKREAVPAALEMAKRYRLLNEPDEAESICLDILAVEPDHQDALITLLLATTDKFFDRGLSPAFEQARDIVAQLNTSYCKSYYSGIIFERRAKYHLRQEAPKSGTIAHEWFVKAMQAYGEALAGCDPDNQDAVLRWNSCARFINHHPEVTPDESRQPEMLLDAFETPH